MNLEALHWLPNLDVESEWASTGPYRRSQNTQRIIAKQSGPWLSRFNPAQPAPITLQGAWPVPQDGKAVAWSPSEGATQRCAELGIELLGAIDPAILKTVNDKSFVISLREAAGFDRLPKRLVRSTGELWQSTRSGDSASPHAYSWIVRRRFGAAARGMLRLPSSGPSGQETRWVEATEGPWVIEPWVPIQWEASTCGWVYKLDHWELGPPRIQITDSQGQWVSSREVQTELAPHRRELEAGAAACAQALSRAGYVGPFGVDSFLYLGEDSKPHLNPISDCNARFTMSWPDVFPDWPDRNGLLRSWLEPNGPAAC